MSPRIIVLSALVGLAVAVPFAPNLNASCHPLCLPPAEPETAGSWDPVLVDGEVPAINMVVLRDGGVLYWSGLDARETEVTYFFDGDLGAAESRVLRWTGSGPVVSTPSPSDGGKDDLFCSGASVLPGGQVLVAGGTTVYTDIYNGGPSVLGSNAARLFHHHDDSWSVAADMNDYRWYPAVVTMPDGSAIAASGIRDLGDPSEHVLSLERYDPHLDAWDLLVGADNVLPLYPRLHVVPSGPYAGDLVYTGVGCLYCPFGERPEEALWSLVQVMETGPSTGNPWTVVGTTVFGARQDGISVPLALRPSTGYKAEYLVATGTTYRTEAAHPGAEIIDLSGEQAVVEATTPMREGRWHPNGVLLPDGKVFVVGGAYLDDVLIPGSPQLVMNGELFDPDARDPALGTRGTWTPSPPMQVGRGYHSTAVLLPDARVLVGGHVSFPNPFTHNTVEQQTYESRMEIYEPPYLDAATRPSILAADASLAYGQPFDVTVSGAYDQAVLVRPGSTTHSYDSEQRLIELAFDGNGDPVAPPNANLAPPGWYMLFVLDGGVPSVAAFVELA